MTYTTLDQAGAFLQKRYNSAARAYFLFVFFISRHTIKSRLQGLIGQNQCSQNVQDGGCLPVIGWIHILNESARWHGSYHRFCILPSALWGSE